MTQASTTNEKPRQGPRWDWCSQDMSVCECVWKQVPFHLHLNMQLLVSGYKGFHLIKIVLIILCEAHVYFHELYQWSVCLLTLFTPCAWYQDDQNLKCKYQHPNGKQNKLQVLYSKKKSKVLAIKCKLRIVEWKILKIRQNLRYNIWTLSYENPVF